MFNSIPRIKPIPNNNRIIKGRDITVELKAKRDGNDTFDLLEGKTGDVKFEMLKLINNGMYLSTGNSLIIFNKDGRVASCLTTKKNDEIVEVKPGDYKA